MWGALGAAGLAGSAVCSGFETGSYTVDRLRLDGAAAGGDRAAARLQHELARPSRLLSTILVSNNVANYAGSLGLAALLAGAGLGDAAVIIVNALVLTPALLIFGEILPKEMFRAGSDRLTVALGPVAAAVRLLLTLTLVVPALELFGRVVARLAGAGMGEEYQSGRERVGALLHEGVRAGVLTERQSGLIDRAMELSETVVGDVMRPWREVRTLRAGWTPERAQRAARAGARGRYVVVDDAGRPVGAMTSAVLWCLEGGNVGDSAERVVRVSATAPATRALKALVDTGARVAIVDRRGAPVGVVTLRSLLEPLTGELGSLEV
jgi:CBS domain containing-hemolysin-like protein